MIKSRFLCFFLLTILFSTNAFSNIKIVYKINNEIITNIDIENEMQYLLALNNQLNKLNKTQLIQIAKESIVKEKIKENELLKYFTLDQKNPLLKKIIKSFYTKLDLNNEKEFQQYLKKYNLTIKELLKKIEIETTWNRLIYDTYKEQIKVNEVALKEKIRNNSAKQNEIKYLLSEILFENKNKDTLKNQILRIKESINEIGFKNTANTFSIADSAKFGGNIGWVNEFNLSKKITKKIINLKVGEITKPILIGNNYIIIKLEDKKVEINKLNKEQNLEKLIIAEKDRQLNQFSNIYYNKVKINTYVNEL
jgi:peptidyl-prolyl cis-trans isomerase SurA